MDRGQVALACPRAGNRAAGGSRSANRRGSGTGARHAGTTARSASDRRRRDRAPAAARARRPASAPGRRPWRAARVRAGRRRAHRARIDVGRQPALAPQVVPGVLEGRHHPLRIHAEALATTRVRKRAATASSTRGAGQLAREQLGLAPDRLAVAPPVAIERPARQLLARIPLALAEVQQSRAAHEWSRGGTSGFSAGVRLLGLLASRFCGSSASLFQAAPSRSSSATKVGSPPCVRHRRGASGRRRCAVPSIDRRPTVGMSVTRGASHALDLHVVLVAFAFIGEAGDRRRPASEQASGM